MNKNRLIDLLNKIANGEEVPKKIKYAGMIWEYDNTTKDYISDDMFLIYTMNSFALNKSFEALEEEKKDNFTGWKMYQNGKEVCSMDCSVEEKKIPEKLYKYMEKEEEGCYENILRVYNGGEYEINEDMSFVIDKINSIIDYLKSKGE